MSKRYYDGIWFYGVFSISYEIASAPFSLSSYLLGLFLVIAASVFLGYFEKKSKPRGGQE